MELFSKGNAVKLLSHHNMFLLADEDQKTIRQSRKRYSRLAIWTVETVVGNPKLIRLRSYHGTYLTASSKPFLLGTTGERVTQTQSSNNPMDCQTHWEPEGYGVSVKLKSWCGKWMRANGATPPWRKSVTHDETPTSKTKNWLLWYVITVDGFDLENMSDGYKSSLSSPLSPHLPGGFWSAPGSPVSGRPKKTLGRFASLGLQSTSSPRWSPKFNMSIFKQKEKTCSFDEKETVSAVEFFRKAKAVRMRSIHNKYLTADEDEKTVSQGKNGSTENAQWTVEPVSHSYHVIRLKSCYGKYLTASNERFLLGATGKKVMQSKPSRLDSSVEWEPVREGSKILLKTSYGNYLRANDGPPPRRKSVTHDYPHSDSMESVLWDVDVVEILINPQLMEEMEFTPSPRRSLTPPPHRKPSNFRLSVSHSMSPSSFSYISESDESPSKADGRIIDHHINPPPPNRKPSWNPFSLPDESNSDSDVSLTKSSELTNNYHVNHPLNAKMKSTSKKTLHPSPHKLPNSLHLKTLSSLLDISESDSESPSKLDEQTLLFDTNLPLKMEMKFIPSSKKMLHSTPDKKPLASTYSKTPSPVSVKSDSDCDESPSKLDGRATNCHTNPPFKAVMMSTVSPKKTLYQPPHRKLSNTPHSRTPSSLSDISELIFDESPPKPDEQTIDYQINNPSKAGMKSISSSKNTPHRKPSNYSHSKTPSFIFDRSESDSDETPSKSNERNINPSFKTKMKSTPSSKKMLHPPPHSKPSNSPHSKTPSSLSDISDSNSDESPSQSDEISYHINHPFKFEMKSTLSSKKMVHFSPHEKPSNYPHSKVSFFDRSDSDSDESPSKSDGRTIDSHTNPPFKGAMKSTLRSKKTLHTLPHRKPSNSPHLKTSSSLSDISDSECDESSLKSDGQTTNYQTNPSFKMAMKSTPSSSKKMLHRKLSNSPHSKTPSSLSDKSDSESDESLSKLDVQTVDYHINPPFKGAIKSITPSKKMLHSPLHEKPSSVWTPCSISDKSNANTVESPLKLEGRPIYYSIADEKHMEDKSTAGYFFTFRGNSVAELTQTLREETCLEDVVVCIRNPLSGKLSPLRLQLPPNNGILHLVLIPSKGSLYERREN